VKNLLIVLAFLVPAFAQSNVPTAENTKILAFTNGNWFDGHSFKKRTGYSVRGILSFRRPAQVDEAIDLAGGYVVCPFGEAHNHNVEPLNKIDALIQRYLQHGIFYVKDPDNLPTDRDKVLPKLNKPESIDVMFSNGGFTGKGGHPAELVKRNVDRGVWTEAAGDGAFYYAVSNEKEVDQKWPQFLSTKSDFVKTYLLFSEEYARRKDDPHYLGWKGLDPALLKTIVQKAHGAGLRVSTHVESAADFHNALMAGVDEINHTPGFRTQGDVLAHKTSEFQIAESDAKFAARQGVYVVTTLAGSSPPATPANFSERDQLNRRNLALLKKYHVKVALGSDSYRSDTVPEALYLASLGIFENRELLEMWCATTANTIFPRRKIGKLKEGYEASFLVLKNDPLQDFTAVQQISLRVKQGRILNPGSDQKP
jgi:Amidohydrolase family